MNFGQCRLQRAWLSNRGCLAAQFQNSQMASFAPGPRLTLLHPFNFCKPPCLRLQLQLMVLFRSCSKPISVCFFAFTGMGDAMHSGFLFGLLRREPMRQASQRVALTGAHTHLVSGPVAPYWQSNQSDRRMAHAHHKCRKMRRPLSPTSPSNIGWHQLSNKRASPRI